MDYVKKHKFALLLATSGALAGYAYWYFIGCNGESCAITSLWYNSTLYGLVMGALAGMIIKDFLNGKASAGS